MMLLESVSDRVAKLEDISRFLYIYISFYLSLTLVMSVMDYFKRKSLIEMHEQHNIRPTDLIGLTLCYM